MGPKVNGIIERYPAGPAQRNAWLGVAATRRPGVIVGKNAVVAAGAIVHNYLAACAIVGGILSQVRKLAAE